MIQDPLCFFDTVSRQFNRLRDCFELGRASFRITMPDQAINDPNATMPIYEYEPASDRTCSFCANGFELLRKLDDSAVECCPECGAPVARRISAPNLGSAGPSLSESNIEKHGFTQYRKVEKGVYEKTTGKGPDFISDD